MNLLRERLYSKETIVGSHVSLAPAVISELYGGAGFDYVWIDTEHTTVTFEQVQNHLIALRATNCGSVVRIPWNDPVRLKPILEMGPDGVVIPQVNSYEEAVAAIRAFRYPPYGVRGWGPSRAIEYGRMDMESYLKKADETVKILQVENIRAVEDLDRILTIPEIDVLLFGPCDLACSMGKIGQWEDPEVNEVIDRACEKIKASGKKLGLSFGICGEDKIRRWKERGVNMISVANDVDYLIRGTNEVMGMFRSVFG